MSWLSDLGSTVVHGETKSQRKARRAYKRELAAMKAIGPDPTGASLETSAGTTVETEEQRRKRLKRLSAVLQRGNADVYGDLSLGRPGLLGG